MEHNRNAGGEKYETRKWSTKMLLVDMHSSLLSGKKVTPYRHRIINISNINLFQVKCKNVLHICLYSSFILYAV